ncbi:hypothetical protein JB92DRAFT_2886152 [Gautieria morchelliformis]|nr:hypothetical protein JB92DRAFT_2886152 [Gautieria morchelliformis]
MRTEDMLDGINLRAPLGMGMGSATDVCFAASMRDAGHVHVSAHSMLPSTTLLIITAASPRTTKSPASRAQVPLVNRHHRRARHDKCRTFTGRIPKAYLSLAALGAIRTCPAPGTGPDAAVGHARTFASRIWDSDRACGVPQADTPGGVRVRTDAAVQEPSHPRAASYEFADLDASTPCPVGHGPWPRPAHTRAKDHGSALSKM